MQSLSSSAPWAQGTHPGTRRSAAPDPALRRFVDCSHARPIPRAPRTAGAKVDHLAAQEEQQAVEEVEAVGGGGVDGGAHRQAAPGKRLHRRHHLVGGVLQGRVGGRGVMRRLRVSGTPHSHVGRMGSRLNGQCWRPTRRAPVLNGLADHVPESVPPSVFNGPQRGTTGCSACPSQRQQATPGTPPYRLTESRPEVGSSKNRMRGLVTSASPMLTRLAWPPEMPRAMWLRWARRM